MEPELSTKSNKRWWPIYWWGCERHSVCIVFDLTFVVSLCGSAGSSRLIGDAPESIILGHHRHCKSPCKKHILHYLPLNRTSQQKFRKDGQLFMCWQLLPGLGRRDSIAYISELNSNSPLAFKNNRRANKLITRLDTCWESFKNYNASSYYHKV